MTPEQEAIFERRARRIEERRRDENAQEEKLARDIEQGDCVLESVDWAFYRSDGQWRYLESSANADIWIERRDGGYVVSKLFRKSRALFTLVVEHDNNHVFADLASAKHNACLDARASAGWCVWRKERKWV